MNGPVRRGGTPIARARPFRVKPIGSMNAGSRTSLGVRLGICLVLVNDFDTAGTSCCPDEADAPLPIDADAMLPCAVTFHGLQLVIRRHGEILQHPGIVQHPPVEMGWDQIGNDELLTIAEAAGFEIVITRPRPCRMVETPDRRWARIAIPVCSNNRGDWLLRRISQSRGPDTPRLVWVFPGDLKIPEEIPGPTRTKAVAKICRKRTLRKHRVSVAASACAKQKLGS